jgi:hypothetical protein
MALFLIVVIHRTQQAVVNSPKLFSKASYLDLLWITEYFSLEASLLIFRILSGYSTENFR